MRRNLILGITAGLMLAAPAAAQWGPQQGYDWNGGGGWNNSGWQGNQGWQGSNQNWNDGSGRFCRRSEGTTGTILGAAVGGVVGNQVVKGRDRTIGTVVGAVAGGLLGRSIDRGRIVCR